MSAGNGDAAGPSFLLARWLFLRGLAVVFAIAFVSLVVQVDGLVGSRGILPIADFLDYVRRATGSTQIAALPTLCWISPSDAFLHAQCAAGLLLSAVLFLGFAPRLSIALLWAVYLSLVVAGQTFLSFQWDILLLETAVFAFPFAPSSWLPGLARERPPSRTSLWLLRWLLFRLMFASGVVKLTSGDPTWGFRDLSALTFHYWSQPLPTVFAWYASHLPLWVQRTSCVVMYAFEIGFPWLVFLGRRARQVAFAGLVAFQLLIAITGNYGFFNLLSILLCVPLLDDALLARIVPARLAERARAPREVRPARLWLRVPRVALAGILVLFTGVKLLDNVGWIALLGMQELPEPCLAVERAIGPFRSLNDYGLFRVMTQQRREIEIQGSDDGIAWKTYPFRWKPGPVDRAPAWVAPHMPRLDWQMWFASLGPARASRWFIPLLDRLLEGSPPVLALFASNPFPDGPPRLVRAQVRDYRFTTAPEKSASGAWWTRGEGVPFASPRSRR
jgi:hypothetical protein